MDDEEALLRAEREPTRPGELYFSLLSPADWGPRVPHRFAGSFRLESDMRWTRVDEERTERS